MKQSACCSETKLRPSLWHRWLTRGRRPSCSRGARHPRRAMGKRIALALQIPVQSFSIGVMRRHTSSGASIFAGLNLINASRSNVA